MNDKYLPGISLPSTVFACSDIQKVCSEADVLFFVVPHQFLGGIYSAVYHSRMKQFPIESSRNVGKNYLEYSFDYDFPLP